MLSRKQFLSLVVLCCAAATPASGAFAAETFRLGVVGAFSGDNAGYGIPALNAAKLVVEKINAAGGVNGMQVVIVEQDDQCKPDLARNAATKIVAEGINIVMGHTCSGPTKAALPIYKDKKIVSVSPSATSPDLTQNREFPLFFRTTPSDDAQARLAADFAVQALNAAKVAVVHDKQDYGKGYADFIRRFIKDSGKAEVVFFEGITVGGLDYSTVVQKIARSGADTLIFGGYYPEASKLISSIRKRGLSINFVSADGVKTGAFLELAGPEGEGVYASSARDNSELPLAKEARDAHIKKFGTPPGQFFDLAYAATQATLNAVEKADGTNPDAVANALRTEYVDTPLGKIRFDDKGDCEGAAFAMFKVVNGQFVPQEFTPQ